MSELIIANIEIRIDREGRYCLNDLHKASGGNPNHRPGEWLRNKQTQALIAELGDAGISASAQKGGIPNEQGTYVAKELVYAYAMWINAAFHLKVIRAYDAMVCMQQVNLAASGFYGKIPKSLPEALRLAADESERADKAETALAIAAPKADALDLISAEEGSITFREASKILSVKQEELTNWLHANGWVYRLNGRWVAYQPHIKNGNLQYKECSYTDQKTGQKVHAPYCHILPKGLTKLAGIFSVKTPKDLFSTGP